MGALAGGDRLDQHTGAIKLNKVPVNPHALTNADSTDPSTWGTLAAVSYTHLTLPTKRIV